MARRTKAQDKALGYLLLIGLVIGVPAYIAMSIVKAVGWPVLIGIAAALVAGYIWYKTAQGKAEQARIEARRAELLSKYGDEDIVSRIMQRQIWQGQTSDQLRDSVGPPVDTDEKVMKKCRREIWKYHQTGANRFGLRVTLEDGVVVGWDEKM